MPSIVVLVHSLDRTDVVMTIYDTAATHLGTMPALDEQQNLRKRVSCVKYFKKLLAADLAYTGFDYATHYSYDSRAMYRTSRRTIRHWRSSTGATYA